MRASGADNPPITPMNRSASTDSKVSLDLRQRFGDAAGMALYPYRLYCRKIDRTQNLSRYYMLAIEPTLFGEIAVVRQWGRIGKRGGEKSDVFATERDAAIHFLMLVRKKRKRGYLPVITGRFAGDTRAHRGNGEDPIAAQDQF